MTEIPQSEPYETRRWATIVLVLSLVAALVGSVGLTGWVLNIGALKGILPSLVSMKANTAIGMCGAALAFLSLDGYQKLFRYWEETDLVESYDLGVNGYVVKPVAFDQFLEAIKRIGLFWVLTNEPPPDVEAEANN